MLIKYDIVKESDARRCVAAAASLSSGQSSPPSRLAPYLPRLPFPPHAGTFSAFDPAFISAAHQYAAAAAALGPRASSLLFCPEYGLAALAALHHERLLTKNSSIADLRLKAKKHAEALELIRQKEAI
ncbi:uncharacterized protein [Halyomorpha halys]|uniref:uncharacterized protein n=1 Tax=Halyomorpha halys TaxID=286706 RepID=UPI0006D4EC4F|nr:uncharacterized protein LOC106689172 [Halyomorpha halys]